MHPCPVEVQINGWPDKTMRPLNLDAGHEKCPYCGVELAESVTRTYPKDSPSHYGVVKSIKHHEKRQHRAITEAEHAILRGGADD